MDAKMDTKSGMQLGICWVKFDTPPSSSGKTAHDIANTVVRVCDGQRIRMQGDEKIKVVLDGRGLRAQKAVKEEMEKRYAKPKPKPAPPPPPPPQAQAVVTPKLTPSHATPSSVGPATPKVDPISGPPHRSTPAVSLPHRPTPRSTPIYNNRNYASLTRAQPIRPNQAPNYPPSRLNPQSRQQPQASFASFPYGRGRNGVTDLRDTWSPPRGRGRDRDRERSRSVSRSRSRSRSHPRSCSTCSSSSVSEDDRHYRPRQRRTPSPRRNRIKPSGPSKEDEEALEKVKLALAANGKSHIFIDEKTLSTKDANMTIYLRDHFRSFHPAQVSVPCASSVLLWLTRNYRFSRVRKDGISSLIKRVWLRMLLCSMEWHSEATDLRSSPRFLRPQARVRQLRRMVKLVPLLVKRDGDS